MKLDYARTSRILIALLFVVAGIQMLLHPSDTSKTISSLGVPFAPLAVLIVIFIQIVVASAFAYGYKTKKAGYILIGFTVLVTYIVHKDFSVQLNFVTALRNIALIGGIMAAIECVCGDCTTHGKKGKKCTTCNNETCSC